MDCPVPYDIFEHRHRFAVWAAARATQRGLSDVRVLRKAVEHCQVRAFIETADYGKIDADEFDARHKEWCRSIVSFLMGAEVSKVSYGHAAKLIAIYFKSMVVMGLGHGTALAHVAHPPIDSILLRNLAKSQCCTVKSEYRPHWASIKWTKLNEDQYTELIGQLRDFLGEVQPFWFLEKYWTVTKETCDS